MRKYSLILSIILLVAAGAVADVVNVPPPTRRGVARLAPSLEMPGPSCTYDLYAGQHMLVGSVTTTWHPTYLHVTYEVYSIYDNLEMTEIHFGWKPLSDMPISRPPNGHLQYPKNYFGEEEDNYGDFHTFTIPREDIPIDSVFIAHAVVNDIGCDLKSVYMDGLDLPEWASVKINIPGASGYFRVSITSDGALNASGYSGWCLGRDLPVHPNVWYDARVISDWDELEGVMAHPENIEYIEWIVRSRLLNSYSERCGVVINRNHIQNAIWQFTEDDPGPVGCPAAMVRDMAIAEIDGPAFKDFERGCWQQAASFVLELVSPYAGITDLQPIYVMILGVVDCPTPTPTMTSTPTSTPRVTRTPRPTRTPRDTPTPTPTPREPTPTPTATVTPTGTWTPPPTHTPTPTDTPTDTPTPPPTETPTPSPTPTPPPPDICDETAYAGGDEEGTWPFIDEDNSGWGWAFECFRE